MNWAGATPRARARGGEAIAGRGSQIKRKTASETALERRESERKAVFFRGESRILVHAEISPCETFRAK
jgi:hypothetical protein